MAGGRWERNGVTPDPAGTFDGGGGADQGKGVRAVLIQLIRRELIFHPPSEQAAHAYIH